MTTLHVRYESTNPQGSVTVILGSSLGTDRAMWSEQLELLPQEWNVVAFDLRGHGLSPLSPQTPTIDDFADDVVGVADEMGVDRFAFCGLSIGGAIGQSLAARHPDRISSLVLASTGLTILSRQGLLDRSARVLDEGTAWVADVSATRWFSDRFRADHPEVVRTKMQHLRNMPARAYSDACLALSEFDGRSIASKIVAPTLVVAGDQDLATPVVGSVELADAIPQAKLRTLPDSAHLCNVEQPQAFTELVREHVEAHC
ncbi:alpha/beta fold hydrolase [Nocardioides sp. NPDC051685]|uniref:alpha/beta fold hydrolase n=1 Tax=Nocardioides sp. NPDC051685 TaxID=3364334 RepID=UPI0037B5C09C